jgi:hypothetical protein
MRVWPDEERPRAWAGEEGGRRSVTEDDDSDEAEGEAGGGGRSFS